MISGGSTATLTTAPTAARSAIPGCISLKGVLPGSTCGRRTLKCRPVVTGTARQRGGRREHAVDAIGQLEASGRARGDQCDRRSTRAHLPAGHRDRAVDAEVETAISPHAGLPTVALPVVEQGTLVDIKSAMVRLESGGTGRFYLRREQHEQVRADARPGDPRAKIRRGHLARRDREFLASRRPRSPGVHSAALGPHLRSRRDRRRSWR